MKKLTLKNYVGYGIADLGNNLGFSIASTFLLLYYSDVLGAHLDTKIWAAITTAIIVIARVWDGINDPIMGAIVQNSKASKFGKFRHFILYGGLALVLAFTLMFLPIKNMHLALCTIFAFVTYIVYGMVYTIVLVPYGSVASVMTRDNKERSRLSISRAIGGGIGGIPAGMLFPLFVYDSDKKIVANRLFIGVAICAVVIGICYVIGFLCTKENYPYTNKTGKIKLRVTLKELIHNKPFVIMSIFGMLLIASSMYINSIYIYLFKSVFEKPAQQTFATIAIYVPMVIMIPFTGIIIKKFGKKLPLIISFAIATIAGIFMSVFYIQNTIIFIALIALQNVGTAFGTLEIWALAMDVIDYHEYKTGKREEAGCYAIFTFMRKIGQALSALVPVFIASVGYEADTKLSDSTKLGIYRFATIVPTVLFFFMFILIIFYPLNKSEDTKMRSALIDIRNKRGEDE